MNSMRKMVLLMLRKTVTRLYGKPLKATGKIHDYGTSSALIIKPLLTGMVLIMLGAGDVIINFGFIYISRALTW